MLKIRHIAPSSQKLMKAANGLCFVAMTAGFWLCPYDVFIWGGLLESAAGGCPSGASATSLDVDCESGGGKAQGLSQKKAPGPPSKFKSQVETFNSR